MDTFITVTDQVEIRLTTGETVQGEIEDIILGTDGSKAPMCILVIEGEEVNYEDIEWMEKL